MDSDIKYIIEEEQKLVLFLENSKNAARDKVEEYRGKSAQFKESEVSRITAEYDSRYKAQLQEIKGRMEQELKEMRVRHEHLLDETELRNKITGRIVAVILENRT